MTFFVHLYYELKKFFCFKPYVVVHYEIDNMKFKKYFPEWTLCRNFASECLDNHEIKNVTIKVA